MLNIIMIIILFSCECNFLLIQGLIRVIQNAPGGCWEPSIAIITRWGFGLLWLNGIIFQNLMICSHRTMVFRERRTQFPGKKQTREPQASWTRAVFFSQAKSSLLSIEIRHTQEGDFSLKGATAKSLRDDCTEIQSWSIFASARTSLRIQN